MNVRSDPRSPATLAAIRAQHALQMKLVDGIKASYAGHAWRLALQTALRGVVPAAAVRPSQAIRRRAHWRWPRSSTPWPGWMLGADVVAAAAGAGAELPRAERGARGAAQCAGQR